MYNILDEAYMEPFQVVNGEKQPFDVFFHNVYKKGLITAPHFHEYIELIYCTEGQMECNVDGTHLQLSTDGLVIINSNMIHETFSCLNHCSFICIKFIPEMLYTSTFGTFDIKYVIPFISSAAGHQIVFNSNELQNTYIPALIRESLAESETRSYGYEMALRTNISKIFLWFLRYWNTNNWNLDTGKELNLKTLHNLQLALDYIGENYQKELKLEKIAGLCSYSPSYFSKLFKQYTRKNFSEYIIYIRISHAEKLLLSTDRSITDIGSACGFASTSYFIKHFKALKGMPPKQFRKMITF